MSNQNKPTCTPPTEPGDYKWHRVPNLTPEQWERLFELERGGE
jgi:hypothetical protein